MILSPSYVIRNEFDPDSLHHEAEVVPQEGARKESRITHCNFLDFIFSFY